MCGCVCVYAVYFSKSVTLLTFAILSLFLCTPSLDYLSLFCFALLWMSFLFNHSIVIVQQYVCMCACMCEWYFICVYVQYVSANVSSFQILHIHTLYMCVFVIVAGKVNRSNQLGERNLLKCQF